MKYIITGGFGFVGNEVCRQLLNSGNQVYILDNGNRRAPQIDDISAAQVVDVDITNSKMVEEAFRKINPQCVIHLAAIHYIPECNADPCRTIAVNVDGTQAILSAAAATSVERVILASSGAVYADSNDPLAEDMLVKPVDIYGCSKLMTEQLAELFHAQTGITTVTFRLFNVFGPRETNPHIIPEIINQLRKGNTLELGTIDTRRDFIFTEDVATGLIKFSTKPLKGHHIVNLASGNHASMRELISLIGELTQREIKIVQDPSRLRKADKLVQVADLTKLRSTLDWTPQMTLRKGLQKLLEFEKLI